MFGSVAPASAQQTISITDTIRWRAQIQELMMPNVPYKPVPYFRWTEPRFWVEDQGPIQFTTLHGQVSTGIQEVKFDGKPIPLQSDGTFEVYLGFPGQEKNISIRLLDVNRHVYQMYFRITPEEEVFSDINASPKPSYHHFNIGIGYTRIQYDQTFVDKFYENAITVKGGVNYNLVPGKWDLSAGMFVNASVLNSTSIAGYTIRYIGVSTKVGYHLLDASSFKIILNGGFYFNTTSGSVGFSNMLGPQLYPEFSYLFQNGHAIMVYGKYSPSLIQGTIDLGRNREVSTGVYYSIPFLTSKRLSVGMDYSLLNLKSGYLSSTTSTYSLSVGLSF